MFRVIYMSTPTDGLAPLEVEQFVEKARLSNSRQDITAFLLRFDQNFLQVLEGAPRKISDLMDKIWKDRRHKDIRILSSTQDNDLNRQSANYPFAYIDLRRTNGVDLETNQTVYSGFDYLRQTNAELDTFLDQNKIQIDKLRIENNL